MRHGLTSLIVFSVACAPATTPEDEAEAAARLSTPFSWSMAGLFLTANEPPSTDPATLVANHFSYVGQLAMNRCANNTAPYSCAANGCTYPGAPDPTGEVATWAQLQTFITSYQAHGLHTGLWAVPENNPEAEAHCMAEVANTLRSTYGVTPEFFLVDAEKSFETHLDYNKRFVDVFDSSIGFALAKGEAPECHTAIDYPYWTSHGYTIQSQAYWNSYGLSPSVCLQFAADYGTPRAMNQVLLDGYAMGPGGQHSATEYADDISRWGSVGFSIWRTLYPGTAYNEWGPLIASRQIATWPGSAPVNPTPPRGWVDAASCSAIAGWAEDPNLPGLPITVHVYADGPSGSGRLIGTALAHDYRGDLCSVIGSCPHGFTVPTPGSIKDGQTHAIYVYGVDATTGVEQQLGSSPKTMPGCADTPPRGYLDVAGCAQIAGWAQDSDAPAQSINVRVYRDGPIGTGTLVGTYAANVARPDLCSYLGSCNHAVNIKTPAALVDGVSHAVFVYGVDSAGGPPALIAGSPKTISGCVNHPPKGWLDVADCTRIAGWAYDPDAMAGATKVKLYADGPAGTGTLLGTFAADQYRGDLCSFLGTCSHGFSVDTPAALKTGTARSVYAYAVDTAGGASVALGASPKTLTCS